MLGLIVCSNFSVEIDCQRLRITEQFDLIGMLGMLGMLNNFMLSTIII